MWTEERKTERRNIGRAVIEKKKKKIVNLFYQFEVGVKSEKMFLLLLLLQLVTVLRFVYTICHSSIAQTPLQHSLRPWD